MNFSKLDNILIGFFVFVFVFVMSIYFLVAQKNQSINGQKFNDIGTIKEIKNSVKKRHLSMITWHNASESDAIQEDDVIFTNDKSSALLLFKDGSLLNMEGDSLIRLKDFKDSYGIILEKGDIQINNQKKMNIDFAQKNNQKIVIDDGAIFKLSRRNNNIGINSIQGKASLISLHENNEIENGQNLNITKDKISKNNSSITISEGFIQNNTIYLEWSGGKELSDFAIHIAEDFSFTTLNKIKDATSPANIPWNRPVAYVKIVALNKSKEVIQSISRKIYFRKKEFDPTYAGKEQDLMSNMVNLFNKMLENSHKLKK